MSPYRFRSEDGSELSIDAHAITAVLVTRRKKWLLFGPVEHRVVVTLRNLINQEAVLVCRTHEKALEIRSKLERAALT